MTNAEWFIQQEKLECIKVVKPCKPKHSSTIEEYRREILVQQQAELQDLLDGVERWLA
jgi:hypothetical protein